MPRRQKSKRKRRRKRKKKQRRKRKRIRRRKRRKKKQRRRRKRREMTKTRRKRRGRKREKRGWQNTLHRRTSSGETSFSILFCWLLFIVDSSCCFKVRVFENRCICTENVCMFLEINACLQKMCACFWNCVINVSSFVNLASAT